MSIHLHHGDLPAGLDLGRSRSPSIPRRWGSIRTATGCAWRSSRPATATPIWCSSPPGAYNAPNLRALLADPKVLKLFHFGASTSPCCEHTSACCRRRSTAPRSPRKLARTFTDRHGLKDLCRELLGVELSKQQQSSDWGAAELTPEQLRYAASDVLHLHALQERLDAMLAREGRTELAQACFAFLPTRAELDLAGWGAEDIFAH